jgi:hypothetical protein
VTGPPENAPPDLISPSTRRAFRESLVGAYMREITEMFQDEGFAPGPEPGEEIQGNGRRLIQTYFNAVRWSDQAHIHRLLRVFEQILRDAPVEGRASLIAGLASDGFVVDSGSGQIAQRSVQLTDDSLNSLADSSAIRDCLRRMADAIDTDPRLAVSAARALVESTAKFVLSERQIAYTPSAKLPALVANAQQALGLGASAVDGSGDAADALRKILGSLTTLTQGLIELRNRVGVDHGRESVPGWVRPRHARMAAGAAQVWCQLMLETLDDSDAPWRSAPA